MSQDFIKTFYLFCLSLYLFFIILYELVSLPVLWISFYLKKIFR